MALLPIAGFWLIAFACYFSRGPLIVYAFFGSIPFGAFAVVPPQLTAGLTFTPTTMLEFVIIVKMLGSVRGIEYTLEAALRPSRLLLLVLFWTVAVVVTVFMPRILAGEVMIVPMRGLVSQPTMLEPTTQNISQLAYLTISVFAVVAFARLFGERRMRDHLVPAIVFGASLMIGTGLADYASQFVPLTPILDLFRTASYALLTDAEILGGKRVVGLMPEASSYGSLCVSFLVALYFLRRASANPRTRFVVAPALLGGLAVMAFLSTSSTAYVALVVFGGFAAAEWIARAVRDPGTIASRVTLTVEFFIAFAGLMLVLIVVILSPGLLDPIVTLFDKMVLQKASTSSFEERAMWTAVSFQAFLDSALLGVGLGGTRSSSGLVAVLSNVGLLGSILYFGFIFQTIARPVVGADAPTLAMVNAVRWSLPIALALSLISGTTADFGPWGAFRLGLMSAIAFASEEARLLARAALRPVPPSRHPPPHHLPPPRLARG